MEPRTFSDDIRSNHDAAANEAAAWGPYDAWIGGESTPSESGERFETRDPAVDEPITTVARCDAEDVDDAISAADEAFESGWSTYTPAERSAAMRDWIDVLRDHRDELGLLESLDTGKPVDSATNEVDRFLEFLDYYASIVRADQGRQLPIGDESHAYIKSEPYGVAGLVLPWNYPLVLASWKIGPALAAGNTVVAKPAETSPLSLTRAAQLSAGVLPDGVFNVVHGFGDETGAALTSHPGVDKLSFTGEDATGELVMSAAAANITPVTLELGGKSPFLVFPDADLESTAEIVARSIFYNTGQSCNAASRVLVHEDVHDEFVEAFLTEARTYEPGDPLAPGTVIGPLASQEQYEKVTNYVEVGIEEGASLVQGGDRPSGESFASGWFFEPTVFVDATNDMRIAQEEIFGPVQTIISFESYEEAITLANDVEYGLAAGVATNDLSLAHRVANDVEAGNVWVNKYGSTPTGGSFGGFKRSGIGRECGVDALEHYTQRKTVNIDL